MTLLATINGSGYSFPPLWIFKATLLPFRVSTDSNGMKVTKFAAHILPSDSLLCTSREVGGMYEGIFVHSVSKFVVRVKHLTANDRKILLVYSAQRANLSLRCLSILKRVGIEAYSLLSHTSGYTQSLDVTVYSPFNTAIDNSPNDLMRAREAEKNSTN